MPFFLGWLLGWNLPVSQILFNYAVLTKSLGKTCKKEFANFLRKRLGPNSIHPKLTQDERRQKST